MVLTTCPRASLQRRESERLGLGVFVEEAFMLDGE